MARERKPKQTKKKQTDYAIIQPSTENRKSNYELTLSMRMPPRKKETDFPHVWR